MKPLFASALLALAVAAGAAPAVAAQDGCVRAGLHEVCVHEHGCTVYWWSGMPPYVCV